MTSPATTPAAAKIIPIAKAGSTDWQTRLQRRQDSALPEVWAILDAVKDPEVPALSLWDLGVLRNIAQAADGGLEITITPTYSGCPALETMRADIATALQAAGYPHYRIVTELNPPWSSTGLSPAGREQLRAYGIAPPCEAGCAADGFTPDGGIECPQCGSTDTRLISEFGSTACKALFSCTACQEPFDYFKTL